MNTEDAIIKIKNFLQKGVNFFGFKLVKKSTTDYNDLDEMTKVLTKNSEPVIFDVGANKGQSIKRYKKLFKNSIIHSFEPNIDEINNLKKEYNNKKEIFLNNYAVGEKEGNLEFNINAASGLSLIHI